MAKPRILPKLNPFLKLVVQAARRGSAKGHKMLCQAKNTDLAWSRCVYCKAEIGISLKALDIDSDTKLRGTALSQRCHRKL